jgi:hypothetical protein
MNDPSTTPGYQPYQPYQAPPPPPPKTSHKLRNSMIFAGSAVVLLLIVAGVLGSGQRTGTPPAEPAAPMAITTTTAVVAPATAAAPVAPAKPAGDIPGDGTFSVPGEVAPGVYKTDGADTSQPIQNCYWARLSGTSGSFEEILANGNAKGPITLTIRKTDKAVQVQGCLPWRKTG